MGRKVKQDVEYRYYEMPKDTFIITLTGPAWVESRGDDRPHYHNYLEVGYCRKGRGVMILDQEEYEFTDDCLVVIPPEFTHSTLNVKGELTHWEYIYVDGKGFFHKYYRDNPIFAEEVLHRINSLSLCTTGQEHPSLVRLMQEIVKEMEDNGPYYREMVRGLILTLLLETARIGKQPAVKVPFKDRMGGIVSEAVDYVSIYYGRQLRVEDLAFRCSVSESYFRKVFGEAMHMTPMEYINLVRIHMACQLLEKTEDSVRNIAERVGLPSLTTFNRNFEKILGMSPGAWRKHSECGEHRLRDYRVAVQQGWKKDWFWSHTMDQGKTGRNSYEG